MEKIYEVAFVGNSNVGKSSLINKLSNSNLKVANWPGVTVEKKEVFFKHKEKKYHLIDLPGISSFSNKKTEERITFEYLTQIRPDLIVNVVDSTNLDKNLYLTMQLLETDIPMIVVLNFKDEFDNLAFELDLFEFKNALNLPIMFVSCKYEKGITELMDLINRDIDKDTKRPSYFLINDKIKENLQKIGINLDFKTLRILEENKDEKIKDLFKEDYGKNLSEELINSKHNIIDEILAKSFKKYDKSRLDKTRKIDDVILNPFFSIPILIVIIISVFSLALRGSDPFINYIDAFFNVFLAKYAHKIFSFNEIFESFLVDGVIGGLGLLLSFSPLIFSLYFFLALLEESGYIARVSFILDKFMSSFGLSGKAVFPIIVGFGCNVPSVYLSRGLENEESRKLTAFITGFTSCGARLPIYALFSSAFLGNYAVYGILSMYIVSVLASFLIAFVLYKFNLIKSNEKSFIVDLPLYRLPTIKILLLNSWTKTAVYIKRACTTLIAVLCIFWSLSYFPNKGDVQNSYISHIGKTISPVFKPLGFGDRWETIASLPAAIIAKEGAIASLSQFLESPKQEIEEYHFIQDLSDQFTYLLEAIKTSITEGINVFNFYTWFSQDEEGIKADFGSNIIQQARSLWSGKEAPLKAISYMIFMLLTIPCIVTLNAIKNIYGLKFATSVTLSYFAISYFASLIFFQVSRLFI